MGGNVGQKSNRLCGLRYCSICVVAISTLLLVGSIVIFFIFSGIIKKGLDNASKMCDASNPNFDSFKSPSASKLNLWAYNLTNPAAYLKGAAAELHEIGPYSYDDTSKRFNVQFSGDQSTLQYFSYRKFDFTPSESCTTCTSSNNEAYQLNIAYMNLISSAGNEAKLILSLACTTTQIGLLISTNTYPYCTIAQQHTSALCKCCDPSPLNAANATYAAIYATCAKTISPASKGGGALSWLAKYDGGFKTASGSSDFPLSIGTYNPLVARRTVSQTIFGHGSVIIGSIIASATLPSTSPKLQAIADLTHDMGDICYKLYCPQISSFTSLASLLTADCSGIIPSYTQLMEAPLSLSEDRAKALRYLEGVNCKAYTPTVVLAAMARLYSGSVTCVNPSESAPCCIASFTPSTLGVPGMGCVAWINGVVVPKRIFTEVEAVSSNTSTLMYTGCASDDSKKYQMIISGGNGASVNRWYTPTDSSYTWADPLIMDTKNRPGTLTTQPVSGVTGSIFPGTGIKSNFLSYQLTTDDSPLTSQLTVWSTNRLKALPLIQKDKITINSINANTFMEDYDATDIQYKPSINLHNLLFTKSGLPVIASPPNFFKVSGYLLDQSNNTERMAARGGGIKVFKDNDGYGPGAPKLATPIRLTPSIVNSYGADTYATYLHIEPATGLSLGGQGTEMVSAFTQNCNPSLDATCALMLTVGSMSRCYPMANGSPFIGSPYPIDFPCSVYNVFSPLIHGGKIIPTGWVKQNAKDTQSGLDSFKMSLMIRQILGILVLIIPIVAFFIIIMTLYLDCIRGRREAKVSVESGLTPDGTRANAYLAA
eukprot:gene1185-2307_t